MLKNLLIIALFFNASALQAQQAIDPAQEAEWVEIRKFEKVYEDAVGQNKLSLLEPLLAPEFTAVTVTGSAVTGFSGLQEYFNKMRGMIGEGGSYSVDVSYEPGTMFGDTALAHGSTADKVVTSEGRVFEFSALWTAVLVKRGGSWKLLRLHSSMDPLENAFVSYFGQRKAGTYTWGAGVAGLLIGLVFCAIKRKCCS